MGIIADALVRRLRFAGCALLVTVAACTSSPSGRPSAGGPAVGPTQPSPSGSSPTPIADARSAVTIQPPAGGSLLLHGTYPRVVSRCKDHGQPSFDARYPGTLTATRAGDGTLTLTLDISFERYLEGIAEVPPSWPMAALQAQAVAARSFALAQTGWTGPPGETLHTPICATTSCQVYRGLPVEPETDIGRWYDAVRATAGTMLLFGGRPADTVYFSTSNGRTRGNEEVFGSSPLPYLRPVAEHDDRASPESHWSVTLPFGDLARFLRAAGDWPDAPAISDVVRHGSTVIVSGHGASRSMDLSTFRSAVNGWAACLEPDRYPSNSWKGTPLPVTIPSVWFSIAKGTSAAVVKGKGWGHGVGMVQWGAYGKAKRGLSTSQILAYYYGGLKPKRFAEPGVIRVQVGSGLTSLSIVASGPGGKVDGLPMGVGALLITGGPRLVVTEQPATPPTPTP
jgi:SpoIID/LytB domain protein